MRRKRRQRRLKEEGGWHRQRSSFDPEANERDESLNRFAETTPPDGKFSGSNQGAGLRHWIKELIHKASYAANALGAAMQRAERMQDTIKDEDLMNWGVDAKIDSALHMALHSWTSGTAQSFIGNLRTVDPNIGGIEVCRQLIG